VGEDKLKGSEDRMQSGRPELENISSIAGKMEHNKREKPG